MKPCFIQEACDLVELLSNTIETCRSPESLPHAHEVALNALARRQTWTYLHDDLPAPERLLALRKRFQDVLFAICNAQTVEEVRAIAEAAVTK